MEPLPKTGYDAPRANRSEDALDRWRFSSELMEVINNTPAEWSVRIGLTGKWGEGKSTVLHFIENMALRDGHLVVWFVPWAATSLDELWAEFANRLLAAIEDAGLKIEGLGMSRAKVWTRKAQRDLEPVERLSEGWSVAKAGVGAIFSLIRRLARIDGAFLKSLRRQLGDKRVVVLLDDLDRTDPKLVPQLLLSLRELLDLSGFSFVLAFDDEAVDKALSAYHPGWEEGHGFLEKILDFRYRLPPVTPATARRLFESAVSQFCPYVDRSAIIQVEDLIPLNARKIKALVRNLATLKSEVLRHDTTELNWVDILIAQMMKLESAQFFDRLLIGDAVEEQIGIKFKVQQHFAAKKGAEAAKQEATDPLHKLLNDCGVKDDRTRERIVSLIEAARARASASFRYQAEFAVRPHRITWKEFREVFAAWRSTAAVAIVADWIDGQAAKREARAEDVVLELSDTILSFREQSISAAAGSNSAEEQDALMGEAESALNLLRALMSDAPPKVANALRSDAIFQKVLGGALYWIHFRTNASDKRAREVERDFLLWIVQNDPSKADAYLEVLKPWIYLSDVGSFDQHAHELQTELRGELTARLLPHVAESVLALFGTASGISRLTERGRLTAYRYALFAVRSPLRSGSLKAKLFAILALAEGNSVIHENCIEFFQLLLSGMRGAQDGASLDDFRSFLNDADLIGRIWKSVVARRIQFRMHQDLLKDRQQLIEGGAPETVLPIPDWLKPPAARS